MSRKVLALLYQRRILTSRCLTSLHRNFSVTSIEHNGIVPKPNVLKVHNPPVYERYNAYSTESGNAEDAPGSSQHINKLVNSNKIVVFMKGIPSAPQCGFSNAVAQILRMHGIEDYDAHNVLENDEIRQGVKDFSDWPTIPQVFFNGEFIGGCDILLQMHQSGDLIEELEKIGIKSTIPEK